MKVNIGTYSFGGMESYLGLGPSLKEKFQKIKSLGFDGVELLPVDLDNPVEDIKAWADEVGLEIVSVHAKPDETIVKKMAALGGKAVIWASRLLRRKASGFRSRKSRISEALSWMEVKGRSEPPWPSRIGKITR